MTLDNSTEFYILFELSGTTYAVKSREVQHMEMLDQITPVPNAPPFMDGIAFSRGQVVPVVNLRVRFGFPRQPHSLRTRLLIVRVGERSVGLIVDSAREFRAIAPETIQPAGGAVATDSGHYIMGIAVVEHRLILILDLNAALNLHETPTPNMLTENAAVH